MFEKRSAGTTYDDHDSHPGWDSYAGRVRQQRAGVAEDVMSTWTGAFYDYAEQLLKAQRQFVHSMLGTRAAMRDVARDVMSSHADEGRSGNQRDARSDQPPEGLTRSRKNEPSNDDDTAGYAERSIDSAMLGDYTSDTSRTERANTQTDESAKSQGRGAASAARKL